MRHPLETSNGTIRIAPLALIDLETNEGVTGRTYLFCYTPLVLKPVCELLVNLGPVVQGLPVAPLEVNRALCSRFRLLGCGASDLGMPDAMKIGGVSGWLQAAALASAAGMPISTHLFPEVSVHLMAATPTRHWLEFVDWASPILARPMAISNGKASVPEGPGTGIEWDEPAVARCIVH
jgi:L-alanine-DL-glutamate epimerase-like enolase superfamily enzyme